MRKANFLNCVFLLRYFQLNKPGWREQDCARAYSMCVRDYWTRALSLALADGVKWALVFWQARLSLVVIKIRILSACSTRHNIRMRKWSQSQSIQTIFPQNSLAETDTGPAAAILAAAGIRWPPALVHTRDPRHCPSASLYISSVYNLVSCLHSTLWKHPNWNPPS